jgi:hypothetical protein
MVELELIRFPSVVYWCSKQYIGRQSCYADKDPELFRFDPYLKNCCGSGFIESGSNISSYYGSGSGFRVLMTKN